MTIRLEVVTPERLVYADDVDAVVLPGSEGELGVLPHHAPLITTLGLGELRIRKSGYEDHFAIVGGFLQVRPDKVVVMAEEADDTFDENALACAAPPDYHHGLAAFDFQVDPAQDVVLAKGFEDPFELNHGLSRFGETDFFAEYFTVFCRNHNEYKLAFPQRLGD